MTHIFLNGTAVPQAEAKLSVDDRGFRFGDGLFETIAVHEGVPYLWEYHMQRLAGGLKSLHIPCATDDLLPQAQKLLAMNQLQEGLIRIHISRGVGSQGYLPTASTPTVLIQTMERPAPSTAGVTLWLSQYEKISPRALPSAFKLAQGLGSTLARMEAVSQGCDEALQLGEGGCIAEASSANIFWRKDNVLYTPSLASGALAGITRRRLLELSPYPVREGVFPLADITAADAVILTNASRGIMAVTTLQPQRSTWASATLAAELNALRNQDITSYCKRVRESLART